MVRRQDIPTRTAKKAAAYASSSHCSDKAPARQIAASRVAAQPSGEKYPRTGTAVRMRRRADRTDRRRVRPDDRSVRVSGESTVHPGLALPRRVRPLRACARRGDPSAATVCRNGNIVDEITDDVGDLDSGELGLVAE